MGSPIVWGSKTTWTALAAVAYGVYQLVIAHDQAGIATILAGLGGVFLRAAVEPDAPTAPKQ